MILKFKTGKGVRGLMDYLSKGAGQDSPLFTNMVGSTPRALAREVAVLRSLRPNLGKAAGHLILAHDPGRRDLNEAEWKESLDLALAEHDAQDAPYAAWLHLDAAGPHLHVFLLRIRPDGSVVTDSNSYRSNERGARAIEAHLGLDPPKQRTREDRPPRGGGVKAERRRRRFERLAASITPPDQQPQKGPLKMIDPSIIFSCIDETSDLDGLKKRLAERGIEAEFVQAPGAAEPTGWSLRQGGAVGTWIKGSDVSRDLSLKKVQERIRQRQAVRQAAASREALGDLLDTIDDSFKSRLSRDEDAAQVEEDTRVWMAKRQKSLAQLIANLSIYAVRVAVGALVNGLAKLIECVFGLSPGALGRIEVPKFESTEDVPVGVVPPVAPRPDADTSELKRRALAQKVMTGVLDQACTAIEKQNPTLLPGLSVKDTEVQAARAEVFKAIEESRHDAEESRDEDDDQDDEQSYERERPR